MIVEILAEQLAALFGIARDYGFLFLGAIVGFFLGFLLRRAGTKSYKEFAIASGAGPQAFAAEASKLLSKRRFGSLGLADSGLKTASRVTGSITTAAGTFDLEPQVISKIQTLIAQDKKIEAIKLLREVSGVGLAEAKSVIEGIARVLR